MKPLPRPYSAIDTLCSALTPPTVATINIADKRQGTAVNLDANAASRVQSAPIWSSAPGPTKMVVEMRATGDVLVVEGDRRGSNPRPSEPQSLRACPSTSNHVPICSLGKLNTRLTQGRVTLCVRVRPSVYCCRIAAIRRFPAALSQRVK
jgi:hypothetical protein